MSSLINNLAVIVPIYNEEKYIGELLKKLKLISSNIIVVDNCSTDKSVSECLKYNINLIKHPVNIGKAESMKSGSIFATYFLDVEYIAFMDGDLQHDTSDLLNLYRFLIEKKLDIVVGKRDFNHKEMPFIRSIGNKIYKFVVNILYKVNIDDIQCGMRVMKKDVYNLFNWELNDNQHYFFDAKMTLSFLKLDLKYNQYPIKTIFHDKDKGMNFIEGLYLLLLIFYWRF